MTAAVRPRFVPPPYQDAPESGRLILRDGTTAQVRLAQPDDSRALQDFFQRLSPESRWQRFFSMSVPSPEWIATLCDCSRPASRLTLVVTRIQAGEPRIVANGSYLARDEKSAEVAFAVDDAFHGKGLGTLLLERLALLAVRHGFTRFWAVTHTDNQAMLDVFRESGFPIEEKAGGGEIEVDLSVIPGERSIARLEMRDRVATVASLRPFFQPRAVAVVGASRKPGTIGDRLLQALLLNRFQGPIYPVNPRAQELAGLKTFSSVRDLPEPVDLAIVAVPRPLVPAVVEDCAARGVRALVIISAGFAEVGPEGRRLQGELLEKVRGHGMRLIGPNCMGLLNADPEVCLNASFSPVFPPHGPVAMSSQSGALGLAILTSSRRYNLGFSTFVSVGNKADVSGNDLLQYWEEDPATAVILLYLESFGNPRRFSRIARRVSRRKPIIMLKSGRTRAGGRAAGSHTAALAANNAAVDALFQQTGVVRADTLEDMFDLAIALGNQPLPRGRRVGIITNAGGPGILCADTCEAEGLVVPELSPSLTARLAAFLPPEAALANPIDLIASATGDQFRLAVEALLTSSELDALIVIYISAGLAGNEGIVSGLGEGLAAARKAGARDRPVLACLMADGEMPRQLELAGEKIPCYSFPEKAARVLGKMAGYADWRSRPLGVFPDYDGLEIPRAREVCRRALADHGPGWLSSLEIEKVLRALGLPWPDVGRATSADEAVAQAGRIGYPVALKLDSRTLVHKTEIGGVHLNLADAAAVRGAFQDIQARLRQAGRSEAMDGVVIQPMFRTGVEVMVGVTQDPLFGPLIAFGLGGIHVEILEDVCFRVTPLTDRDAHEMIRAIRGFRLLEGYRGHPPADLDAIAETLLRVSRLVEEIPEITELDLNPIFALPPGQGCMIADARVQVRGIP